jgi:hypothetical protein
MRTKLRSKISLLFMTCAVLLAIPVVAIADDISNNLDASIDAVAETMPLQVGGANGTTTLYVVPQNDDGKNGCNLTGSTTLVANVTSSNPSVATVSPGSVTFDSCSAQRTLTVTPVAAGSTTISLAQSSNSTSGTFNLAPATFTVNVSPPPPPANTPPEVAVAGVTGGASYNKGSVPNATCEVTDAEDGNSSFAATLSAITGPYASDGIGSRTASCSYTDDGGLTAESSETYSIVDPSPPVITKVVTPASPDGDNGWYKSDVKVDWTVSDPESPNSIQTTGCVDQNITTDQAATTYSCSATSAGGSAPEQSVTIKRDATAPNFNCGTADADWHATDVNIACTASDGGSGLANAGDASFNLSTSVANGVENSNASTGTRTVLDAAGNSATAGPIAGNKVDKKAPTVLPGDVTNTTWRNSSLSEDFTSSDGGSGLALNQGLGTNGSFTLTASAESADANTPTVVSKAVKDAVGNTTTRSVSALIDLTNPSVSAQLNKTAAATGWFNTSTGAPTVSFLCSDALSGLAGTCPSPYTFGEGANQSRSSGNIFDNAGNSNSAGVQNVNVDLSDPTNIQFVGGPAAGESYDFGNVPAPAPTCTADDTGGSGLKDCAVTGYSTAAGTHTMTAKATDNAGNSATATRTYTVARYRLSGFYQPVDMNDTVNTVKNGSTVPVKFELFQSISGTELTSTSAVSSVLARPINCDAFNGDPVDPIEMVTTGGTSLRYDATAGQFIYNWQTPKGASQVGKCYSLTMTAADSSTLVAYFKLK